MKLLWRTQIKPQIKLIYILLAAAAIHGCSREEPKKEFVARVNDSYLTREEISGKQAGGSYGSYYRSEYIRNWIQREILYQAALREGILDDPEFKKIADDSRKELAAAFILNRFFEEESFIYEPKDIEDYFHANRELFRLADNAILFNLVSFKDEDRAVRFRLTAIETDWNKSLNAFKGDSLISSEESNKLQYEYEVHPAILLRMLQELYPQEISIVLTEEPGKFLVAQLVEKYSKGTIPPFETIKQEAEKRFVAHRKEMLLKDYLSELYSDNEIEVKGTK